MKKESKRIKALKKVGVPTDQLTDDQKDLIDNLDDEEFAIVERLNRAAEKLKGRGIVHEPDPGGAGVMWI